MKLLFRRDLRQETKGMISRSTVTMFLVHARMEVTPAERELIERFALSQRELYAWTPSDIKYKSEEEMRQLTRSVTVAGLVQGYDKLDGRPRKTAAQ